MEGMLGKTLKCGNGYVRPDCDSIFNESSFKMEETERNQYDSRLSFQGKESRNSIEGAKTKMSGGVFEVTKNKNDRYQSQGH